MWFTIISYIKYLSHIHKFPEEEKSRKESIDPNNNTVSGTATMTGERVMSDVTYQKYTVADENNY